VYDFWRVASSGGTVVIARVERYVDYDIHGATPFSMEIRILRVVRGAERRKFVKIWGGLVSTNPGIAPFAIGSKWAFVLADHSAVPGDYTTGDCSRTFVRIREGAKGPGVLERDILRRLGYDRDERPPTTGRI
jgi:hypothetical protein